MQRLVSIYLYVVEASTLARRLSAIRQFYRFLLTDGVRADDPTVGIDTPRLGRPLRLRRGETLRTVERTSRDTVLVFDGDGLQPSSR